MNPLRKAYLGDIVDWQQYKDSYYKHHMHCSLDIPEKFPCIVISYIEYVGCGGTTVHHRFVYPNDFHEDFAEYV